MKPFDTTAPSQTESISFEIDLPHPPEKAGARYGWNMMSGKLVDLLERIP